MKKFLQLHLHLSPRMLREIGAMAEDWGVSRAEIIRTAIREFLHSETRRKRRDRQQEEKT